MRKITVYDWENTPTEIEFPDDMEIDHITVRVLSGDETGEIVFTDGTELAFDASCERGPSYFDGHYTVPAEKLDQWESIQPQKGGLLMPYKRLKAFQKD